jgi:hypothetical protein
MTAHIIMSKYNNKRPFGDVSNPWGAKNIGAQKGINLYTYSNMYVQICIYILVYTHICMYVCIILGERRT